MHSRRVSPLSQSEYEAALSEFMRRKGVTRCPTACVAPTFGTVADTDRIALRSYEDSREAARVETLVAHRNGLAQRAISPA